MDLISNPSDPSLLALDIHDNIKLVNLESDCIEDGMLTRDDFSLKPTSVPGVPQPADSSVVKCMAWCSASGQPLANALATGLNSGKVVILWPGDQPSDTGTYTRSEFVPHVNRTCNAVSWNEMQPTLLAIGLERYRNEHSLLIWDITTDNSDVAPYQSDKNKIHATDLNNSQPHTAGRRSKASFTRAFTEACFAESVSSIIWTKHECKTVIAGVSSKHLRLYDIRNVRSASAIVNTKAVQGICQDPLFENRFASFYDNQIHIWDLRNFTKPAAIVSARYNVIKIDWCPTRCGLLASLCSGVSEGRIIHGYDMTHATVTENASDIAYRPVEQIIKPKMVEKENISTFAWYNKPSGKNSLIMVTSDGVLYKVSANERISVTWQDHATFSAASDEIHLCNASSGEDSEDLSMDHIMHKRAANGYGLDEIDHADPKINLEPQNKRLHDLWKWIESAKEKMSVPTPDNQIVNLSSLVMNFRSSVPTFRNPAQKTHSKFVGLHAELSLNSIDSTCTDIEWRGVSSAHCNVFSSPERTKALEMCGWQSITKLREEDRKLEESLSQCEDVERAATVALWHLDMRLAINILQKKVNEGSDPDYSVIAMALSGYSGTVVSPLWRELCSTLQKTIPSHYFRAGFAFLNAQQNGQSKYNAILHADGVSMKDRAAFACNFLPDEELINVMDALGERAVKEGDLDGVIITGLVTERGVDLIQNYVDQTKDVQTAVLAIVRTNYSDILNNPKVSHMLDSYKTLLNRWMLWNARARLDIALGGMARGQRRRETSQGVFVQCNYCGKSVRNNIRQTSMRGGRGGPSVMNSPGMMSKVTSCPQCRKPLPRCSVCGMFLGTSPSEPRETPFLLEQYEVSLDSWFSWCPVCQHGGHAKHLNSWFRMYPKCALTGCACKCTDFISNSEDPDLTVNKR